MSLYYVNIYLGLIEEVQCNQEFKPNIMNMRLVLYH